MNITGARSRRVIRNSAVGVVAAVLLIGSLGACARGSGADPTGASLSVAPSTGTTVPTATESGTATDAATPTSTDEKVLENGIVRARRAGLSFAAPAGWQAVDPTMLMSVGADAVPDFFARLAKTSGVTVKQLADQIGRAADVVVLGPPARGFAPNISVVPSVLLYLPSADELRREMTSVGATGVLVRDRDTPIGRARVVSATLRVGTATVASRSIIVEHGGHVSTITVSSTGPARSDALVDDVIASLAAL